MKLNKDNPRRGKEFENEVRSALEKKFNKNFSEKSINIGNPPKLHKFDLVSEDENVIVECKNYSWTETGNVPSAKMAFANVAVLYLSHIKKDAVKIIVLRKDNHRKRKESLAEYYVRIYKHLLKDICIMEMDTENNTLNILKE